MKLLVVSHACVTPINQDLFARVQHHTGWEVSIVLPARWRNDYGVARARRWPPFDGELLPLPALGQGRVPLHVYAARLGRLMRRERPDAVYVHNEPYAASTAQAFVACRALQGVPLGFYSAQNLVKRYPLPVRLSERYVHRRASFAMAVSEAVAGVLQDKGYRGPLEVIPLSVDTARYAPVEAPNVKTDRLTAGFVGRLTPEKGVETIIDALASAPAQGVRLLVVGEGPSATELRERAAASGVADRVDWFGYVAHDEMPAVYRQMDVLVVPSRTVTTWKEQFGRVVIEALASGVPVIASDSGELPQLMSRTGGGWNFPEGDAASLSELLSSLSNDPSIAHEPAARGRQSVINGFGVDHVARRFAAMVSEAVEASR